MNSKKTDNLHFIEKISYQKTHPSVKSINQELFKILDSLKLEGFFTAHLDTMVRQDNNTYLATFLLGKRTEELVVNIPEEFLKILGAIKKQKRFSIKSLSTFKKEVSKTLSNLGVPFSKISFQNYRLKENKLFLDLVISKSEVRFINKVLVKGYEKLPKSFIKHYLEIDSNTVFTNDLLKETDQRLDNLSFIKKQKQSEVLFKQDSTIIYIYVEKRGNSSFDGLLNFGNNPNGNGVIFNGTLDLTLNNNLDFGESFSVFWRSYGEDRQEFNTKITLPYLFSSRFQLNTSLNIYKQDSSFLNTKFYGNVFYNLNHKNTLGVSYNSEISNLINDNPQQNNIDDFSSNMVGVTYEYKKANLNSLNNQNLLLFSQIAFGNRKKISESINQFKFDLEVISQFKLSSKNSIYIRNQTGFLQSKNYLFNELYRIGGINSLRGFADQSIFTPKFSYINLEYRHLTDSLSYLYLLTDFGYIKTITLSNEYYIGLGFGYFFNIKTSQINLSYVLGKSQKTNFNFDASRLNISFKSFF